MSPNPLPNPQTPPPPPPPPPAVCSWDSSSESRRGAGGKEDTLREGVSIPEAHLEGDKTSVCLPCHSVTHWPSWKLQIPFLSITGTKLLTDKNNDTVLWVFSLCKRGKNIFQVPIFLFSSAFAMLSITNPFQSGRHPQPPKVRMSPKIREKGLVKLIQEEKDKKLKLLFQILLSLVVFKHFCSSDGKFHHLKSPNPTIISKAKRWCFYFIPILSHLFQHSGPCFKTRLLICTKICTKVCTKCIPPLHLI